MEMGWIELEDIDAAPALSQTDINYGYEIHDYDDGEKLQKYITSDPVNHNLRANKLKLEVRDQPFEVAPQYSEYAAMMVEHHLGQVDDGAYEDHNIAGIVSDLTPDCTTATIAPGRYFDLLATTYAFPYIYKNEQGNVEFQGSDTCYNEWGVLYPLSMRRGVNPIGSSTLAMTRDGKALIVKHADDATSNPGRLMPSGSGVTSWHDYTDHGVTSLQGLVMHCAEYKLRLECSIPDDVEMKSRMLGFARVPNGMKPDFFCLTRIGATADELVAKGVKVHDFVGGMDVRLSEALRTYIDNANAEKPGAVAIQLYLATRFLAEVAL